MNICLADGTCTLLHININSQNSSPQFLFSSTSLFLCSFIQSTTILCLDRCKQTKQINPLEKGNSPWLGRKKKASKYRMICSYLQMTFRTNLPTRKESPMSVTQTSHPACVTFCIFTHWLFCLGISFL